MDQARALAHQGIDQFNRWQSAAVATLDRAIDQDARCALAHAVKGLALVGGRHRRFQPLIEQCEAAARDAASSARERMLARALSALAVGQIAEAIAVLETWLVSHPTDLLVHRVLQQELFWNGQARWMRDVAARARPAWSGDEPDYSVFLSVFAFSHEEAGDYALAERAGRESIERNPHDPWGAHAVAHVLEMQNRHAEGIEWLESLSTNWGEANQIAHHLWWHLCLFHLERDDTDKASVHEAIITLLAEHVYSLDDPLVQAMPDAYIDIQNVASLLLRLELRGVDAARLIELWERIATVSAERIANHSSPFTSAHAVMALAALGQFDTARELIESLRNEPPLAGTIGPRIHAAAIPAAEAALAHRQGDDETVIARLFPARRDLWQMGGSHAQRDIFIQVLADACRRSGRRDLLSILATELRAIGFVGIETRSFYADCLAHRESDV